MYTGELKQPVTILKGLGPHAAHALARLNINVIGNLLLNFPRSWEDRQNPVPLNACKDQPFYANTVVEVIGQEYFGWGQNRTLKVIIRDATEQAALLCFGRPFLKDKLLPRTKIFTCYGQVFTPNMVKLPGVPRLKYWKPTSEKTRARVPTRNSFPPNFPP